MSPPPKYNAALKPSCRISGVATLEGSRWLLGRGGLERRAGVFRLREQYEQRCGGRGGQGTPGSSEETTMAGTGGM